MFIAMNRFKVVKGEEAAFETVWSSRKTRLDEMPGFLSFHLLKGPEKEDHTLYSSHTSWVSKEDFTVWTKSEQFRESQTLEQAIIKNLASLGLEGRSAKGEV